MEALIQENVSLQAHNTMAVPARAKYFLVANDVQDLLKGIKFAKAKNTKLLVLGEGSNTLFVNDYDGLVILNQLEGIEVLDETEASITLKVAAGENWHELVTHTVKNNWYGLENLALIPGLVGSAPIQNIGAYGVEVKDTLQSVEFVDIQSGVTKQLNNKECQFDYRDSIFKHELADKVIVTLVTFKLEKSGELNISYPALQEYFGSDTAKLQTVFNTVCEIRSRKLPNPKEIPNTGSFFKNPIVNEEKHIQLKEQFPSLVSYKTLQGYKLAAGWLIEQQGWKQKEIQGVKVHEQQALVITNPNSKGGEAVLALATAIQEDICNIYGVKLEIEPIVLTL